LATEREQEGDGNGSSGWLDPVGVSLRMTLAALLLRPIGEGVLGLGVLALAVSGLVLPAWLLRSQLWAALTALAAYRVIADWPLPDNHAYLLVYWCLAITLALRTREPRAVLAVNGRLLVGLVFGFAALWKLVLSPDFWGGDFMRFTWIVDERFEGVARLFGGMDARMLDDGRSFLAGAQGSGEALVLPDAFLTATRLSTLWTVLVEPAVALCFLIPPARLGLAWGWLRDASLLVFCATVYAVAPVEGFAWLLLAMGAAQVPAFRERTRVAYLIVYVLVLAYRELDWTSWLVQGAS
jgi:hypothetical protein